MKTKLIAGLVAATCFSDSPVLAQFLRGQSSARVDMGLRAAHYANTVVAILKNRLNSQWVTLRAGITCQQVCV